MPKKTSTAARLHGVLFALHPALFSLKYPAPLKIGIAKDIVALYPEMPENSVGTMLAWLTNRRRYLAACTCGAQRFGIEGPSGIVDEKQAAFAAKRWKSRNENSQNKMPNPPQEQRVST